MAAKIGFWIDHSHNPILGATVTLSTRDGSLLISGLTQLVALAGGAVWAIMAFTLHEWRTSSSAKDALFYQEQVVLRNSTTGPGDVWQLLQMGHAWRKKGAKARRRTFGLLLFPLLIWSAFTVAGLFVSRITTPGYKANNVLMKPGTCGFTSIDGTTQSGIFANANRVANDTSVARAYAQKCYAADKGTPGCASLPVQSLNYTVDTAASCPFDGSRCIGGAFGALQIDSGWIDSHHDLGINARASDRVQVRLVNTCSVIHYSDLLTVIPDNTTDGAFDFYRFFLGPIVDVSNYTIQYSTHTVNDLVAYTIRYSETLET